MEESRVTSTCCRARGSPIFMAEARDFIAVTNAEVWELQVGGRQVLSAPFINVSRDHIEIILPGH
jgi:hypothetical protein